MIKSRLLRIIPSLLIIIYNHDFQLLGHMKWKLKYLDQKANICLVNIENLFNNNDTRMYKKLQAIFLNTPNKNREYTC